VEDVVVRLTSAGWAVTLEEFPFEYTPPRALRRAGPAARRGPVA
jgi:hypothetical protein